METLKINIVLNGNSLRYPISSGEITGMTNQIASSSNILLKDVNVTKISSEDCIIKQTNSDIANQQPKRKRLSGAQRRKKRRARNEINNIQHTSKLTEMGLLSDVNKTPISIPISYPLSSGEITGMTNEIASSSNILLKDVNVTKISSEDCTIKQTNSNIVNQQLQHERLSKTQKRKKRRKAKTEISSIQHTSELTEIEFLSSVNKTLISMASAAFTERCSSSKVRNESSNNRSIQQSEYNSNLNEISTLSSVSQRFLPMENTSLSGRSISSKKPANLSGPNSEPLPSFRMAIMKSDFPAFEIMPEEVKLIQNEILKKIDETPKGESLPLLNNFNLIEGSLIISCENRFTCHWLWKALDGYVFRDGTVLRVIQEKDLPQLIKVAFWTSDMLTNDTYKLLLRLKNYNPEFKIEDWIILEKNIDSQGQQLIILVDIDSFKAIRKANYKAYTGVDQGTFSVLKYQNQNTD